MLDDLRRKSQERCRQCWMIHTGFRTVPGAVKIAHLEGQAVDQEATRVARSTSLYERRAQPNAPKSSVSSRYSILFARPQILLQSVCPVRGTGGFGNTDRGLAY
jgi:hypothetical protein